MSNYNTQLQSNNTDLQAILDSINELPNVGGSGFILQDKTVAPSTSQQVVVADNGYDGLNIVTVNAIPTATQATPYITVGTDGLITVTATQTTGYVVGGTKTTTKTQTTQAAKTVVPAKTYQIAVDTGRYTTGTVKVAPIPDEYITTTDATAAASEILSGETAYVNGSKVTGTMSDNGAIDGSFDGINTTSYTVPAGYTSGGTVSLTDDIPNEVSTQADLIAQIQTVLATKAAYNTIYVGTTEPTADIGVNGDIYIVRSES